MKNNELEVIDILTKYHKISVPLICRTLKVNLKTAEDLYQFSLRYEHLEGKKLRDQYYRNLFKKS